MMQVIEITGGLTAEPQHATGGGQTWRREPGESLPEFRVRVEAEAEAAGADFLVVGGLP